MSENNIPKQTRGVTLREPKDIRRVVQRIASKAFQEGSELEYAGRDSPVHGLLDEGMGMEKLSDFDKRLSELEKVREEAPK